MLSPFLRDAVGPVCRSRRANDLVVMATAVWPSGLRAVWRAKGPTNPGVSLNEPTYDIQIGSTRISMPDRCGPIGGLGDWLKHKATTSLVGLLRPTKPEGNFPLPEHHVGLPLGTRRSYHLAALGSLGGVWSAFQGQGLLAFLLLRRAYSSLPRCGGGPTRPSLFPTRLSRFENTPQRLHCGGPIGDSRRGW